MNNFTVGVDSNGTEYLFHESTPVFNLTQKQLLNIHCGDLKIQAFREAKIFEIQNWRMTRSPEFFLIDRRRS